ncbi:MAG: CoA pyrophosphatase [Bacteroidota bacterium]
MQELVQQLTQQLQQELPGREAQYKMAHGIRHNYREVPDDARQACVLALLYPIDGVEHIVLIQRVSNDNPNDRHRGQISFPGGKLEESDSSLEAGALREAQEEVNADPEKIQLIGKLTELYIPVSNFLVHPFVGYSSERPDFQPQLSEVADILEVPLRDLLNPDNLSMRDIRIDKHITLKRVPYFDIQNQVIWGATAMMLSELLTLLRAIRN